MLRAARVADHLLRTLVKRIPLNNRLVLLSAILLTTLVMPGVFGQAVAQEASAITPPPVARVRPVVNDYFGTKVTDPYRYMESLDNPEVARWMKARNDYTRCVLDRIPGRDELLVRIEQLDESIPARVGSVIRLATGHYFYRKSLSKESVFKLYMRDRDERYRRVIRGSTEAQWGRVLPLLPTRT